jgi:hypothetical protein
MRPLYGWANPRGEGEGRPDQSGGRPARPPQRTVLAVEEARARGRLYPITIVYSVYAAALLTQALRDRAWTALAFFTGGAAVGTAVEYWVHRSILHARFCDDDGIVKRFLHRILKTNLQGEVWGPAGHSEHHERPWDGNHTNGYLDTVPVAVVLILVSFLGPFYTFPVFTAGVLESHVAEEWIHHSVHFYRFKSRYFECIRRHHLYHHSPKGSEVAYGLTSGLWDAVWGTRIVERNRDARCGSRTGLDGMAPPAPREGL